MFRNFYNYLIIMLMISCSHNKPKELFNIEGIVDGDVPNYIYLSYANVKDSSLIENGRFKFKGKVNFPTKANFAIAPATMLHKPFYLENGIIDIELTINKKKYKGYEINIIKFDTIVGTKTAKIQHDFEKFEKKNKSSDLWKTKLFNKLEEIIEEYPKNQYSADLLAEVSRKSILSVVELKELYRKLDTISQTNYSLEPIKKIIYPSSVIAIGKNMFDFELLNDKEISISTKKYRGSILFIDFWASWCAPCRKQNPELSKIYDEFKNKGFEILGVSIDQSKEKWLRAIIKDNLTWENVIDNKGKESEILAKYDAINSIPRNFLVNRKGEVMAKDITMLELAQKLRNDKSLQK